MEKLIEFLKQHQAKLILQHFNDTCSCGQDHFVIGNLLDGYAITNCSKICYEFTGDENIMFFEISQRSEDHE